MLCNMAPEQGHALRNLLRGVKRKAQPYIASKLT